MLYWLSACSTALQRASGYDFDHCDLASVEQAIRKADQSRKQSSAALCRCLGPQCSDRKFGGRIVWKVAPGGTRDRSERIRRRFNLGHATSDSCDWLRDLFRSWLHSASSPSEEGHTFESCRVRQYYAALLQFWPLPRPAGVTVVSLAISGRLTCRRKPFQQAKL